MNDSDRFTDDEADQTEILGQPEDVASAARSCLIILLLVLVLIAIFAIYLIASAFA